MTFSKELLVVVESSAALQILKHDSPSPEI
jgi:hypothetical protein